MASYTEPRIDEQPTHPLDCTLDYGAEDAYPSDADRDCLAAWYAGKDDPGHFDGPTPAEALAEPCEADEEDLGDWWNTLPESPDLDSQWTLTLAGGASAANAAWAAEGREPVRRRSTRGDLCGYDA